METKTSISTKEKIFDVSIDLFSKKGYDNVSIREIAKNVGIKESSIYNHYSSKEKILETIFEYYKKNMVKTQTYYESLPIKSKNYPQNIANINDINPMKTYHRGSQAIKNQWKHPKMRKILKLMFIELYHNEKIKKFFIEELINAPIKFWTLFFKILIDKKIVKETNPKKLAKRYHKYAIFLLFEHILLRYDESLEESMQEKIFDEIFDEVESHFNFVLNSVIVKKNKNEKTIL
ncbi:MAG: TetR/AcrR family transcriptional regulator [Methanobrevibacter sp.]|nr:TetR/AcrR family transcriptional regulator [Methanobrevibacter sp.]MCL2157267.1 TetR/AcrR family transcriptional regulator [Methanobrevibacter sp.]